MSEDESNSLNNILAPSVWENYMARNYELEEITFVEMISKYKWCSNEKMIPDRWYDTKQPSYYKQLSFSDLKKYREAEDLINIDLQESDQMKELRKHQKLICIDNKNQLAKYAYTLKNPKILNTFKRNNINKNELYWFELLINHIPFRSFWNLLIYKGCVYDTFKDVWEARGLLVLINERENFERKLNNIQNLDMRLNNFLNGKIYMNVSEYKRTIANIWKTIECTEEMVIINENFMKWGIEYSKKFENLYRELKKKEMLLEKKDLFNSYKREISRYISAKTEHYIEFWYKTYRGLLMDIERDMCMKVFTMYKRFEPEVIIKVNNELESFIADYDNINFYSNSQRIVINYLMKYLFSKEKNCFYITGNAGTGKSFLLRQLVRIFEDVLNLSVLVWASTGTAAKNINGTTVHKAFLINPSNVAQMWMPGSYTYQSLKKRDVIIIDEISMISEDIITNIDLTLRDTQIENRSRIDAWLRPFGGKIIILFGDLLQIPCVNEQKIGEHIREIRPIYKSDSFANFEWIFLYDQMRQANDYEYNEACNELAKGLRTESVRKWLQRRIWVEGEMSWIKNDKILTSYSHDTTIMDTQDWDISSNRDILIVASDNLIRSKHN